MVIFLLFMAVVLLFYILKAVHTSKASQIATTTEIKGGRTREEIRADPAIQKTILGCQVVFIVFVILLLVWAFNG